MDHQKQERRQLYGSVSFSYLSEEDESPILKYLQDSQPSHNPKLKVKIEHVDRHNHIDKIRLAEYKPSLRMTYNQERDFLDIYERGKLWNKYLKSEKRGVEKKKPTPFWDSVPRNTYIV